MCFAVIQRNGAKFRALLVALFFVTSINALSEVNPTLPQVVVTASRNEQAHQDALPHTSVLTREDIRNSAAIDLPSLLQREAGIQLVQSGGLGQATSLFMRGSTAAQVLILLDGVPLRREAWSAAPALEHILPAQIERIEIVRGNVSAIYGSGAVGGVIQIFTNKPDAGAKQSFFAETGSQGTRTVTGSVSGLFNTTRYSLSVTGMSSDGISARNSSQYPTENPDRDGYRNNSVSGLIAQEWKTGQEFGLRLMANSSKYDFDGLGSGIATDIGRGKSSQQTIALFSKNKISSDWESTLTLSQNQTRNDNKYDSSDPSVYVYYVRDAGKNELMQWLNQIRVSETTILNIGAESGRDSLDSTDFLASSTAAYNRNRSSVYSGINSSLGRHQFQFNLRRDVIGLAGNETTDYAGYAYALTSGLKLIASSSSAFNAPTLIQQFDPTYGNTALRAERARSREFGVQQNIGAGLIRLTAFRTTTRDQFSYDPSTYVTVNIDRARNEGFEVSGYGEWADTNFRFSLTLQDPVNLDTGATLSRNAKTLASLSAYRKYGLWNVGGDVSYTGIRTDKEASQQLSPYWLVNMNARYELNRQWSFHARLINLLNESYQTAYGYNQLPRSFFVGVSWQK
ncbi:MAG: Outer rane vitamin receptor BtuB [Pseudomonadota bacterium]|jgi:vitamin B12 transporter